MESEENGINVEKQINLKELYTHSIYIEKLLENGELSKINDLLPDTKDIIEAWKLINEMHLTFLPLIEAYQSVNHDNVEDFEPVLVLIIFSDASKEICLKSLQLLIKICYESVSSLFDSINAYYCFNKDKNKRNSEIVYFFNLLFDLLLRKNIFKVSSFRMMESCFDYVFTNENEIIQDDNEKGVRFTLGDVLEEIFQKKFDESNMRIKIIRLISSMCIISEVVSRKFVKVLEKELYYGQNSIRHFVLANLFEILYIWPDLLNLKNNSESDCSLFDKIKNFLWGFDLVFQKISVVSFSRFLLNDNIKDFLEASIGLLSEKYVEEECNREIQIIILNFFKKYTQNKTKHQEEIGNAVVCLLIECISESLENNENRESNESDFELRNQDELEKNKMNLVEIEKKKLIQINFLMNLIQKRFYSQIVENVKYNIETLYDVSMNVKLIQKWLSLK